MGEGGGIGVAGAPGLRALVDRLAVEEQHGVLTGAPIWKDYHRLCIRAGKVSGETLCKRGRNHGGLLYTFRRAGRPRRKTRFISHLIQHSQHSGAQHTGQLGDLSLL